MAEAVIYTIFAIFAVYGMYTALRELVVFTSRLRGKHTTERELCRGCKGCSHGKESEINPVIPDCSESEDDESYCDDDDVGNDFFRT